MSSQAETSQGLNTRGGIQGLIDFVVLYARFARYSFRYWDKILLLILIAQATGLMWVLSAMATAKCVDEGLRASDRGAFLQWCLIWFGVQVALYVVYNITTIMSAFIKMHVDRILKLRIFDHFQKLALRFQQSRPIGENMFRLNNDSTIAAQVTAQALPDSMTRLITIATTGSLLFTLNSAIALAVVVYIVIYYFYSHVVTTYSTRYQAKVRATGQATQAMLQENLSAYVLSKAFARERHESRRYFGRVANLGRAMFEYGTTFGFCMEGLRTMQDLFMQLIQVLFCGYLVIRGDLTVGEFVAVGQILFFVIGPMQILVQMLIWFRVSAVTLRRMLQTLDVDPEIEDAPDAANLVDPSGELAFENVAFRYTPDGQDVLKGLSFRVPPGKKLAIVGASGAGKTTIFNLLMRYYDPTGGRVLVDGQDLKRLRLDSYRSHLSIVLQDNFMYSATIRDNILFGKPDADTEALARAVRLAGLQPLLDELPRGLDTVLKEGGDLSSGQLQRIGIARAVIRDPKYLFLDEATSSLDPRTEHEILEQLKLVEHGRTRLVIAHNIVSVRDADEILVMSQGELVQQGAHAELVEQEGIYAEMWQAELEKMDQGGGSPE